MDRPRIAIVTAVPLTLEAFWGPLLRRLQCDFDLSLISTGADPSIAERMGIRARSIPVEIRRRPAPAADWRALRALAALFLRERFDLVHSHTPKAGLLTMLAARRAGIPIRIHTFTGQVWQTRRGPWRSFLRMLDRCTASSATALLADSRTQVEFLESEGVVRPGTVGVLEHGSLSGVDPTRFRPDPATRAELRRMHRCDDEQVVILFVGRICAEKGVPELLRAFERVAGRHERLQLWIVGPEDGATIRTGGLAPGIRDRIRVLGATRRPERFMAAADVLVLPSHREGFGTVVIEAAACGIPSVASRTGGLRECVIDGVTGFLHEPRDWSDLASALERISMEPAMRAQLGAEAQRRAIARFDPGRIAESLVDFYRTQMERAAAPVVPAH